MKIKTLLFSIFFVIISCNEKNVYHKVDDDFSSNRWENKDKKRYDFSIDDDAKLYNLTLFFSHVYDYQFEKVPFVIEFVNPAGLSETFKFDLQIKDANGKDLADCGGDYCDLKHIFKNSIKLQKGNYAVIVSHEFKGPYLPNVLAVGLDVDKVE
jgi:gliding motility-associated lipoprotein GldH